MSKIKCCINCQDRKLLCHSTCQKYIREKALHYAAETLKRERKESQNDYIRYHVERIRKTKRS